MPYDYAQKTYLQQKAPSVGAFMKCINNKMIDATDLVAEPVAVKLPFREQDAQPRRRIGF